MSDYDETRATARLPHLDIELVHRRPRSGEAEMIAVTVRAVPSLEAVGRMLEASNPWLFWLRLVEAAWSPWLGAAMRPRVTDDRDVDR